MKRSSGPQGKDIRKFFRSSPAVEKSSSTVEKSSTVAKENDARVSPQAHCDDCANKVIVQLYKIIHFSYFVYLVVFRAYIWMLLHVKTVFQFLITRLIESERYSKYDPW